MRLHPAGLIRRCSEIGQSGWCSTTRTTTHRHGRRCSRSQPSCRSTKRVLGNGFAKPRPTPYLWIRFSERLTEDEIVASVENRGDSTTTPTRGVQQPLHVGADLPTGLMGWTRRCRVRNARIHRLVQSPEGSTARSQATTLTSPPAEFEATYYRQTAPALAGITQTERSRNPGDSLTDK
jgi:hypothetical protein